MKRDENWTARVVEQDYKKKLKDKEETIALLCGLLRTHAPHLYGTQSPNTDLAELAKATLRKHVNPIFFIAHSLIMQGEVLTAMMEMFELGKLKDGKEVVNG